MVGSVDDIWQVKVLDVISGYDIRVDLTYERGPLLHKQIKYGNTSRI